MGGMLFLGLGIGQCMQPLTIIVQNAVPPREIGVATSSATFFRQLGGTIGVAVFLSLLFSTLGDNIKNAFKAAAPGIQQAAGAGQIPHSPVNDQVLAGLQHPGQGDVFTSVQNDSSIIGRMDKVLAHPFQVGFADSMSLVLLCGGAIMLVAFAILLLMPPVELRSTSASAAARAEQNAAAAAAAGAAGAAETADVSETDVSGEDVSAADGGSHRAPVAAVVGEAATEPEGRHAGATAADEVQDPR